MTVRVGRYWTDDVQSCNLWNAQCSYLASLVCNCSISESFSCKEAFSFAISASNSASFPASCKMRHYQSSSANCFPDWRHFWLQNSDPNRPAGSISRHNMASNEWKNAHIHITSDAREGTGRSVSTSPGRVGGPGHNWALIFWISVFSVYIGTSFHFRCQ